MAAERDEHGRFVRGNKSNGGRPKGLAERARAATKDGESLVRFFASVLDDVSAETRDRMEAGKWLADRGWGKAAQSVELSGPNGGPIETAITEMVIQLPADEPESE